MAVARNSNRLLFDRILSLDDPRLLDCAVFVTIAALFSLMLISNFGLYGCDDIDTVVRPSPSARYEYWALYDGRYLLFAALRFARLIGLDFLRDYSVFALIYAVSFATFIVAAVDYLTRDIEVSRAERAMIGLLFAALLMTHGFHGELIAWKNCFPFMLLIYFIMAVCLVLLKSERYRRWHYPGLAALFLALNCIYQPATMALFWLAMAWAVVTYIGAGEAEPRNHLRLMRHVAAVAALVVVAGLGYIAVTRVVRALGGVASGRPFELADGNTLLLNLARHAKHVIALVDPSGSIHGPYAGGPVVFLAAILLIIVLREALRRSWFQVLLVSALLGTMLVCSQNLENILLSRYWPSGRSSFYAGLVIPVLWLAAWLAIRPKMERALWLIALVAIGLQTMTFAKLTAERFELQRRDFALAKDIGDAIRSDPALAGATGIRLPEHVFSGYYRGLTLPVYDASVSLFDFDFVQVPIITFVTGLELARTGTASCPASEQPGQVRVRRDGTDIVVCF
jgi:hypothetical protein